MDKLVEILRTVDTPTLSNAIEKLEVRNRISGYCDSTLRCLMPEFGIMCGYAVTLEAESTSPDFKGEPVEKFLRLYEMIQASPKPVVVVISETGAHPEFSVHCGEMMATTFQRLGAVGLVSDSAVRDIVEVRKLRFHYFAKGLAASHGSFVLTRLGVPVTIAGVRIETGDLLHGDENGLITVPQQGREKLPQIIEQIKKAENDLLDYVRTDGFSIEGLRKRLIH